MRSKLSVFFLLISLAAGCTPKSDTVFAPFPFTDKNKTSTKALTLWVSRDLPADVRSRIHLPPMLVQSDQAQSADLKLMIGNQRVVSHLVFALVAPFPTIPDGVSAQDLLHAWQGSPAAPFANAPLLMEENTYQILSAWWGKPSTQFVEVLPANQLLEKAWNQRPSWGIIPFDKLSPRWKVLQVDGISPIHKDFNLLEYALSVPISLDGDTRAAELVASVYGEKAGGALLPPNRDGQHMTVLAMTGVTALVRATAAAMESQGITYPAQDIGDLLASADLTHISNEVAFSQDCPAPDPNTQSMTFCSSPKYIELLEFVGTDIVEMSGDHFADWSSAAMLYTLDLYRQRKWLVYGGGVNLQEGRKAVSVQNHGNQLAFIGCNAKGAPYATASDTNPGAVACDFDYIFNEINRLKSQGTLPIATFQHVEYYLYAAQPDQVKDFRGMAQAGAVIVSGSQAHQPQAIEFYKGEKAASESFIHYGLGNLFFDQYNLSEDTRQAFIDLHIFYDNRYISTELIPIIFLDYARSRRMTADEARPLLQNIFTASGW